MMVANTRLLARLRVASQLNLQLSNLEKFDLFKDIFNHLIEKHNAETFKSHVILCLSYTVSKCCSVSTILKDLELFI
jgi:hypothetical protein